MPLKRRSALVVSTAAMLLLAAVASGVASSAREQPRANFRDLVGREFDARVVRVADGDTLEALPAGESRPIRIRLQGVDTPEQGEVFSREALLFLRTLVFDQQVKVRGRDVDRYNRLVARVVIDGTDTSIALVRAGLACHAYAYDAALAREEAQARGSGVGFWAATAKQPACVSRTAFSARGTRGTPPPRSSPRAVQPPSRAPSQAAATAFHGNVRSRVYHAPACRNYTCSNCTQVFSSHEEAQAAGFRPAGDCLKR